VVYLALSPGFLTQVVQAAPNRLKRMKVERADVGSSYCLPYNKSICGLLGLNIMIKMFEALQKKYSMLLANSDVPPDFYQNFRKWLRYPVAF